MAIPESVEHLDNGSLNGCRVRGLKRQVISGVTADRTLLVGESNALCLFDSGAGFTYTLPGIGELDIGMYFEFLTTVIGTTSYSVATDGVATIGGGVIGASDTVTAFDYFIALIASDTSIDLDSATTGELVGSRFTMTALSTTTWGCAGYTVSTGTPVTPFA
jgi:hypothetical protein